MNFNKIFIILVIAMIVIAASDLSEAKQRKRRKHRKHKHGHKYNANHVTNGREYLSHHQHHGNYPQKKVGKHIIRVPYYVQPFAVPMVYGTGHAGHNNFLSKPNSVAKPTAAPSQDRLNSADGILPVEPKQNATDEQRAGNGIRIPIYYYFVNEANNASGLPINQQVIVSDERESSILDDGENEEITYGRRVNTMPMIVLNKNAGANIDNLRSDRYKINNAVQLPMSVREYATAQPIPKKELFVEESHTNKSRFDSDNSATTELISLGNETMTLESEQNSNVTDGHLNESNEDKEIVIAALNLADSTNSSNLVDSISEPKVNSHGSATTKPESAQKSSATNEQLTNTNQGDDIINHVSSTTELESEQKSNTTDEEITEANQRDKIVTPALSSDSNQTLVRSPENTTLEPKKEPMSSVTDVQVTGSNRGDEIVIPVSNSTDDTDGSNSVVSISEPEVSSHGNANTKPESEQKSSTTDEEITQANQRDEIKAPATNLDDNKLALISNSNQADEAADYQAKSQENTTLEPTNEPKFSVTDEQVTDSNQLIQSITILNTETFSNGLYFFNSAASPHDNINKPSMSDQHSVTSKYDADLIPTQH